MVISVFKKVELYVCTRCGKQYWYFVSVSFRNFATDGVQCCSALILFSVCLIVDNGRKIHSNSIWCVPDDSRDSETVPRSRLNLKNDDQIIRRFRN